MGFEELFLTGGEPFLLPDIARRIEHGLSRLRVTVLTNGLLLTGATIVALSNEDAGRIGVHPSQSDYTVPMSTANGVAKAARVRLREVRVGQVSAHDVEAVVMPAGLLRESLLGMSFLKQLSGFEVASGRLVLRQ